MWQYNPMDDPSEHHHCDQQDWSRDHSPNILDLQFRIVADTKREIVGDRGALSCI
jgi:alkyl hydroperoxide reductase subunit AhpC